MSGARRYRAKNRYALPQRTTRSIAIAKAKQDVGAPRRPCWWELEEEVGEAWVLLSMGEWRF